MNRTTTVVVALIAAAGLSTMVYAVPEQRALAWQALAAWWLCRRLWLWWRDGYGGYRRPVAVASVSGGSLMDVASAVEEDSSSIKPSYKQSIR